MKVGILAVQGDFEAHAATLARMGVDYVFVRTPRDLDGVDAVILPGGESTTQWKFLVEEGLDKALSAHGAKGGAIFGTCAGAILLAKEVRNPEQDSLKLADITVIRNGYGRQLASEVRKGATDISPEAIEMVFIRAPIIERVGSEVTVLASSDGKPVLIRQGRILIATFHPELTNDSSVHEYFLRVASGGWASVGQASSLSGVIVFAGLTCVRKWEIGTRTKVLFLCIGNACRSQMAEAIARHSASDVIEASSAGLVPFGEIPSTTFAVLRERGISIDGQTSKPLRPEDLSAADLVINMTGRSGAAVFTEPLPQFEDWDVGDPYGLNLAVYRTIRDEIEARVEDLAHRLRNKVDSPHTE